MKVYSRYSNSTNIPSDKVKTDGLAVEIVSGKGTHICIFRRLNAEVCCRRFIDIFLRSTKGRCSSIDGIAPFLEERGRRACRWERRRERSVGDEGIEDLENNIHLGLTQ